MARFTEKIDGDIKNVFTLQCNAFVVWTAHVSMTVEVHFISTHVYFNNDNYWFTVNCEPVRENNLSLQTQLHT